MALVGEENASNFPIVYLTILFSIAYFFYELVIVPNTTLGHFWRSTGWGGKRARWLPGLRARIQSIKNSRAMVDDGYDQLNKKEKPFLLSRLIGEPLLVLPPSSMHSLLQRPDNEVDIKIFLRNALQSYHSGILMGSDFHFDVIRHQLTRKLPLLTEAVYEELILAFEDQWGTDTKEWRKVSAYETSIRITSRAANRIFCGPELCRNAEFLDACRCFTQEIFKAGSILNMLPSFLRYLAAPIITIEKERQLKIAKRHLLPVIEKRLEALRNGAPTGEIQDGIQWIIEESFKHPPEERDPHRLVLRVLILNMVAIHTTSISITNTILDLYSSPNVDGFVAGLQEEVERVLAHHDGKWAKTAVNDLVRVDSAIKESMRFSPLGTIQIQRTVIAKDGIDLPNGFHIPPGIPVATASSAIHYDPEFYPNPGQYNAFRFSAPRELRQQQIKRSGSNGEALENGAVQRPKNESIVNTQDTFLSFGHGRHACPGRFFASQELKLMLAHIIMHYEIKPVVRPEAFVMGTAMLPDAKFEIELRMK